MTAHQPAVPAENPTEPKHLYRGRWYSCENWQCGRHYKTVMVMAIVPPDCPRCGQQATAHNVEKSPYWELIPIPLMLDHEARYDASFYGKKAEILAARREG